MVSAEAPVNYLTSDWSATVESPAVSKELLLALHPRACELLVIGLVQRLAECDEEVRAFICDAIQSHL